MGIQRMIQAGAIPITWIVFAAELQRDWARLDSAAKLAEILMEHGGASGTSYAWELQLMSTTERS
jgi:adenylosuccinate lyase